MNYMTMSRPKSAVVKISVSILPIVWVRNVDIDPPLVVLKLSKYISNYNKRSK